MSFVSNYIENPTGRSFILSSFIVAVMFTILWLIPFAPYEEGKWYLFLYKDVNITPDDRFNVGLVIIDILLLLIFFFHLVVAFGNSAEMRNTLPGWSEVLFPFVITLAIAAFQPRFGITGSLSGGEEDLGFNHFTADMQIWIFWTTFVLSLGLIYYFVNSGPKDDK
ncbi:MAG: hypothetical protein INQ03_12975 [Candidatus Heimdallarchaeota archaeon]|nr:hypothetical protein [Candidatus Heimdallarchaeota archaeon]